VDHAHDPASLLCADAKPNDLLASSRELGWNSVLVDHHEGAGCSDVFETHSTHDLTLVMALSGLHRVDVGKGGRWRSAVSRAGCVGLTPPGETNRIRWATLPGNRTFRTAHLYLPHGLVDEIADEYRRIGQPCHGDALSVLAAHDPVVGAGVSGLLAAMRCGAPDLYAAGASRWLITHILSRHAGWRHMRDDPRAVATMSDRRLATVTAFMNAELGRELTLSDLAREAGMSVHHFGRCFRARTGLGPAAYLTILRLERARELLRETDLAIAEIASACGYTRATAFATAFRRHVGRAPSDYRLDRALI